MKNIRNILWGLLLIAVGVIVALNILDIIDFDLLFDGWWTLFIIVPSVIGLFDRGPKIGNILAILIGVALLLAAQDIIDFGTAIKISVPAILICVGVSLIFRRRNSDKIKERIIELNKDAANNSEKKSEYATAFAEENISFEGQVFNGTDLNAIFGGIKCDLRGAVISQDVVINASAIFGGITILMPDDVNIKVHSYSIFGGVSQKKKNNANEERPTVYVNAECRFGGVSII